MTTKEKVMKALDEAVREIVRLVVLAVIPLIIAGINVKTGVFNIDWNVVLAVALVTILRAIDRYLHIYNTTDKPGSTDSMGLVRTNW